MSRKIISVISSFLLLSGLLLIAGCSGGGGGGSSSSSSSTSTSSDTVSSLEVGEKVSVVDPKSTSASKVGALKIGYYQMSISDLPADSDYNTDETHVYVEERSAESLEIVNEILCMVGQSGYEEMLNKGDYKAQIDIGQCEGSKDSASNAGEESQNQSSGSNATEYEFWTVNSSRESATAPQVIKAWIHQKGDEYEPAMTIHVKFTITESVSDTNPYGIFTMFFQGIVDNDGSEFMHGFLKTEEDSEGNILMKFYCDGGDSEGQFHFTEKVTLDRASDGSSGAGTVYNSETNPFEGDDEETFNIAYNDNYFYRSDGSTDNCLTRENPDTSVWRYGLYYSEDYTDDPGGRVTINSGFPIKYGDYHGWAGYYGIWLPEEIDIPNGATVYKQDYSSDGTTETEYTMLIVGGKLKKHTKKTLTLQEIAGIPVMWSNCSEDGGSWSCIQYRVKWNSTDEVFYKSAQMDEDNWVWKEIDPVAVTFGSDDWDFNFWSESLGGNGRINLRDPITGDLATLTNSSKVVFHVESTVFPGESVPNTLACFESCPDPSAINTASPYFAKSSWQSQENFNNINMNVAPADLVAGTNYIAYGFNEDSMLLTYDGSGVVMSSSQDDYQNGVWTGAMFEPSAENLAKLACDWDDTDSSTCQWQAWDKMDVFYTWETGTQNWNKLTALQDTNGNVLSFDPPLSVEYTHTTGTKYYLEYNGFGDLHGIPGKCVDMDTGEDIDCWQQTQDETKFIRWVPEFSVADGTSVVNAVSGLGYYVKALEKEERMRSVDTSECTGAGLSLSTYTLPDDTLYEDPEIGTEPTVTDAPAIIGGILQ